MAIQLMVVMLAYGQSQFECTNISQMMDCEKYSCKAYTKFGLTCICFKRHNLQAVVGRDDFKDGNLF
jgi:hypothetical protein